MCPDISKENIWLFHDGITSATQSHLRTDRYVQIVCLLFLLWTVRRQHIAEIICSYSWCKMLHSSSFCHFCYPDSSDISFFMCNILNLISITAASCVCVISSSFSVPRLRTFTITTYNIASNCNFSENPPLII